MEFIVVLVLLALFAVGLVTVAGVVSACDSSRQEIVKRGRAEIDQIVSEGKQAMNDLSEQYLSNVYDQFTDQRRR